MTRVILKLSHGEITVLTWLAADFDPEADYDNTILTQGVPGGWYYGIDRISGTVCMSLVRQCLISKDGIDEHNYRTYKINEWGRKALAGEQIDVPNELLPFMRIKRGTEITITLDHRKPSHLKRHRQFLAAHLSMEPIKSHRKWWYVVAMDTTNASVGPVITTVHLREAPK